MMKNKTDFNEIFSHDQVAAMFRDIVEANGATIERHEYDQNKGDGRVFVSTKTGAHTAIPYHLPDDRAAIRELAIKSLEPPSDWQHSQPRR